MLLFCGAYPFQQAFCVIKLKPTRDPIQSISKLDYLKVLQYFHVHNKNENKVFESEEYQQLEEDQRQLLLEAWKNNSNSEVTSTSNRISAISGFSGTHTRDESIKPLKEEHEHMIMTRTEIHSMK
jgi:selenocysteine lyase/cysteine desulfurase